MTNSAAEGAYIRIVEVTPEAEGSDIAGQIAALQPRLFRFALTLTRNPDDAADLAQDTVARALAASWRFTPGSNLPAWLFRILRNLFLNRVRDGRTGPRIESLDNIREVSAAEDFDLTSVERRSIERASLAAVREVFAKLPSKYAEPIHLVSVEGLSYAETAEVLNVPIGTVMSRIYRGRRLLLAALGGIR